MSKRVLWRAVEGALSTGYPDPPYQETLLTPPKPEQVAAFFEEAAARKGK